MENGRLIINSSDRKLSMELENVGLQYNVTVEAVTCDIPVSKEIMKVHYIHTGALDLPAGYFDEITLHSSCKDIDLEFKFKNETNEITWTGRLGFYHMTEDDLIQSIHVTSEEVTREKR